MEIFSYRKYILNYIAFFPIHATLVMGGLLTISNLPLAGAKLQYYDDRVRQDYQNHETICFRTALTSHYRQGSRQAHRDW